MGGHSHWANIKHKKGAADAKRGKAWTKLSREISIAAKLGGGGDPDSNPRLRKAIVDARDLQMPSDTITRAIKRGAGELEGAAFEELVYEGYAPGGVALLIECTSDNRNRTRGEIHTIMAKNGGSLGAPNSVAWMFKSKGYLTVKAEGAPSEDEVMGLALDLGAEDFKTEDDIYEIFTPPNDLLKVKDGLVSKKIAVASSEVAMIPDNLVSVLEGDAPKVLKLIELLEDLDDVKNVYANFDIPDAVMEKLAA
ncbi:MAG TPA: YebC/PmpR family DNA-binding transcriptional regulator [Elusimicrobia bacterium]|nr:MAG: transcriptional regulator [Elusimicrobia bacterium GWA2_66_18]OGR72414.1 MAG: transcriptional regulator [Elusimicrobia bacterium GWC2_65_9]HAZ07987.1 YebC/PmpR family DNA-binding transcriptional regulator [Elusimicrobiota bacterium]